MPDDIEQIEARLAAYIDDALPEQDRAEIEAYLATNPAHQQLVRELRTQRARLAKLPRELAPAEVMDHLQSHLERQALLENVDDDGSSLKINRWPQWTALAAVLLLTAGLGMLIYSVLPKGDRETFVLAPAEVQKLPPTPPIDLEREARAQKLRNGVSDETFKAQTDMTVVPPVAGERHEAAARVLRSAPPADSPAVASSVETGDTPKPSDEPWPTDRPINPSTATLRPDEPLATLDVTTDDPALTQSLIAGYLAQNAISFRMADTAAARFAAAVTTQPAVAETSTEANQAVTAMATPATLLIDSATPAQVEALATAIATQRGALQRVARIEAAGPASRPVEAEATTTRPIETPEADVLIAPPPATTLPAPAFAPTTAPATLPSSPPALQVMIVIRPSTDRPAEPSGNADAIPDASVATSGGSPATAPATVVPAAEPPPPAALIPLEQVINEPPASQPATAPAVPTP